MPANRSNIGWYLDQMIAADAGVATPKVIFKAQDGITDCYGITVPSNDASGYAPGCTFRHVDGEVVATGTVDSGDATSLIDATLTATYDSNDELIGMYVIDVNKRMYGLIDDYAQSTGDITVNDWLDLTGTAIANATVPVSGDAFIVFKKTSGNVLYVNVGNDITGCRFEQVLTAGMNESTALDTQDGPSQAIWGGVDLNALRNFSGGFLYENDFMGETDVTNDDGWAIDTTTSGTIHPDITDEGGVIVIDSAGNATADDGINAQLTSCAVLPAAGKKIYFEVRVKMKDTGDDQYYIGLAGISTAIIVAGVVEDSVDKAGFFRDSGASPADDKLTSITARTSDEDETADVCSVVDNTWTKLGIVIDGLTSIKFYQDGKLVETGTTTANIANAWMCLTFSAKVEQTSADAELHVDWVRVAQVGVRNA